MANTDPQRKTRLEHETERLKALSARRPKDDRDFPFTGVLLSDAIKKCCDSFGLITPLKEDNLKPANYKLRIGDEYAIRGKIHPLSDEPGKNEIVIEPFDVAILKTLETINMPRFLIGRWNIQVSKAYKGLLWVGGPQVDAGYVGNLFCPIYNLSDKSVTLHYGDPIAVIDFEKTSQVTESSKAYADLPERILFQDYEPETLQSALSTQVRDAIKDFRIRVESASLRVDTFVSVTFTLLGILFAAGALLLVNPDHSHWYDSSVFWTSAIAIALSGYAVFQTRPSLPRKMSDLTLWVFLLALIVAGIWRQSNLQSQINDLKGQLAKPAIINPLQNSVPSPQPKP